MKYRVGYGFNVVMFYKINLEDESTNKVTKFKDYSVELTDENLEQEIKQYNAKGIDVEIYKQKRTRGKGKIKYEIDRYFKGIVAKTNIQEHIHR